MENAHFQPYEGQEPYIFASYSHADSETVLPVLDALHRRGFRVWYDQGIPWTAEWENVVANHVAACAVCLAFHSKRSQTSIHCDAELMYARRKNRPILSVYLEDGVELSPGVEMYLTRYQSAKWKDFPDVGAFLDRMEREKAFQSCKGQAEQIRQTGREKLEQRNQANQPVWHYDGEIKWSLTGDGVLTIAGLNPNNPANMPNYTSNDKEKKSTAPWMRYREKIVSVVIERSIRTIGNWAFYGCTGLTGVQIPDSVSMIGGGAFYGCTGLTGVQIPDSVSAIGDFAFYGCTGLTSVQISDSVSTIGDFAFSGCTGLTSVQIPDSVSTIGGLAFRGCTGLTSVQIPDSVSEIGWRAFADCENLKEISLPAGVMFYRSDFLPDAKITVRK